MGPSLGIRERPKKRMVDSKVSYCGKGNLYEVLK